MLRGVLVAALSIALALSGCSGRDAPPLDGAGPAAANGMAILGLVQNETFAPVPGAQVSLRLTEHIAVTDAGGLFSFTGLPLSPYLVDVVAAGFANATLNAEPGENVSLSFVLVSPLPRVPEPVVLHFQGNFQCAFEALIITPSCDTVLDPVRDEVPQTPDVFEDISTFEAILGKDWSTVVMDLDFDEQPGLDGLRITLQGRNDADQLGAYEKYGQFHGSQPYTARVAPGESYDGGDKPVPANATAMQFEVYPQGHAWHPGGVGVLGAGVATSVQFDLYVTVFFVEPAPEGYSLLA